MPEQIDQPRPRQEGMTAEQKMATAPIVEDGQWYEPTENPFIHGCCECGLSHRVEYLIEKGALSLRFFRDAEATAALMLRLKLEAVPTDVEVDSKEWWRQVAQGLAIKCREAEARPLVSQPSSPATPETTEETIVALAERLKLDLEVIRCDCGSPYRESDAYDLACELVHALKKTPQRGRAAFPRVRTVQRGRLPANPRSSPSQPRTSPSASRWSS